MGNISIILYASLLMVVIAVVTSLFVAFLTVISSRQRVVILIDKFFNIVIAIPEILRDGCIYPIRKVMAFLGKGCNSVGVGGENSFQRIIGSIILCLCVILSFAVTAIVLTITLDAIFGEDSSGLLKIIPMSIETLMATELILSTTLFGLLLFDVLGITSITKFFSAEHLTDNTRQYFCWGFAVLVFISVIMFAISGYMRYHGVSIETYIAYQEIEKRSDTTEKTGITTSDDLERDGLGKELVDLNALADRTNQEHVPPSYMRSVKILIIGIPILSAVAGLVGFVGVLPLMGMCFAGILFVLTMLLLGVPWAICSFGVILNPHIVAFFKGYFDIVIDYADENFKRSRTKIVGLPSLPLFPSPSNGSSKNHGNQIDQTQQL